MYYTDCTMKYGNGQVDKIKRFLKEHKVTAFECMDEYTVSIITNVVNSVEIDKLKNQTVTNQKLNRLFLIKWLRGIWLKFTTRLLAQRD